MHRLVTALVFAVLAAFSAAAGTAGFRVLTEAQQGGRADRLEQAARAAGSAPARWKVTTAELTAAQERLRRLATAAPASMSGYDREQFGPAWSDDVDVEGGHNGCDTRSDQLRRDLVAVTLKAGTHGCVVLTGRLDPDPYTGAAIDYRRGSSAVTVHVDHVVALGDAWQTGAQQLPLERRRALANDPRNLQAVSAAANTAKGDRDASAWLPPVAATRCGYAVRQIAVKSAYELWVTRAERSALARVLNGCLQPSGGVS